MLGVSRGGFYAAEGRAPSRRAQDDAELLESIRDIHSASRATYGVPRVHAMLARRGFRVGPKRVARLMRREGLSGLIKRRRRKTTIRVPGVATAPDLVRREWNPKEPNRLWVALAIRLARHGRAPARGGDRDLDGREGSALDNAVVESLFATLKRELVNHYSWPTKADARVALFQWIEAFYNRTRLHTTLGNYAPEEFETLSLTQAKEAA